METHDEPTWDETDLTTDGSGYDLDVGGKVHAVFTSGDFRIVGVWLNVQIEDDAAGSMITFFDANDVLSGGSLTIYNTSVPTTGMVFVPISLSAEVGAENIGCYTTNTTWTSIGITIVSWLTVPYDDGE